MNTITLINEKGGVGKSTLSNLIASGLAIRGGRVLLIDADPQANTTKANRADELDGLYRVIAQDAEWSGLVVTPPDDVWKGDYTTDGTLALLPSAINNRLIPLAVDDPDLMAERLDELRPYFDTIVIDTSPTPSMLHAMIYRASTHIIVPTQFELWSMQGMINTISRIEREQNQREALGLDPLTFMGIQPNLFENTNAHAYGLTQTRERYGDLVWEPIAKRTVFRDAAWSVQHLFVHSAANGSPAESEAWALIDNVMSGVNV